jgi:hypothetical protein
MILGRDGLGYSKTRLQDRRPYSLLIGSYTEIDVQFNAAPGQAQPPFENSTP